MDEAEDYGWVKLPDKSIRIYVGMPCYYILWDLKKVLPSKSYIHHQILCHLIFYSSQYSSSPPVSLDCLPYILSR